MTIAAVPEAVLGGLLLFFVPGYALTKATFPEWRISGPGGLRRLVEVITLSFVVSVVLTVLAGYVLLDVSPGGFAASWSNPVLESVLGAIAGVGLAVALMRGAFSHQVPASPALSEGPGDEGAWEVSRELEALARDERRLEHQLRVTHDDPGAVARLHEQLDAVRARRELLRVKREEQYAA